jgi:iron complex outermembrane recepter protein
MIDHQGERLVRSINTQASEATETENTTPWKKRALAVAVASALSVSPAMAQDDDSTEESEGTTSSAANEPIEEIITVGIRQSLMDAQALKRNADTVVDTITAADIGDFPDKSVAEALQRVAGITVNRFAASSDTAHFSAEPSGVIVRGLNQVRTEFNGRDSFSANSSRGLSWGDVSPELMAGVDTYKNQMAELIEGGIAGTVNMRTRLPFDQDPNTFAMSGGYNYGDISEEWTPELSGLYSTRWDLDSGGELGVMVNAAYSHVKTRTEGLQLYRQNRIRDGYGPDAPSLVYMPAIVRGLDNLYDRERLGVSAALQWANEADTLRLTAQYNRSEYDNAWEEYLIQTSPFDESFGQSLFFEHTGSPAADSINYTNDTIIPVPLPGSDPFTFDSNGMFTSGVITRGTGWWGNDNTEAAGFAQNAAGQNMVNACYGWNGCEPPLRGIDTATGTRSNNNQNMTQDLSFNLQWAPSDTWRANFDVQYIDSTVENYDIEVTFWTFAVADIDLTGARPQMALLDPLNVNQSPGGFENPNNYYIRSIMDHVEDSEGDELALRADFEFDLDSGWMESLKVGTRYADRNQQVQWSGYNWQNVSNVWTGNGAAYWNLDRHEPDTAGDTGFLGYPEGYYETRTFNSDFYGGGAITPNTFVFANMGVLQNQEEWANAMGGPSIGLANAWDPICSNVGDRAAEIPGTCYTPAELADVTEESTAFYIQLNYGGGDANLFGVPISGNVGVRYVRTDIESRGGVSFPLMDSALFYELVDDPNNPGEQIRNPLPRAFENLACYPNEAEPGQPAPSVPNTIGCYISETDFNFQNGAQPLDVSTKTHENWLPSFNIKFEFNDEWLLRFAASRAMARPDIGNLRNYIGVGATLPDQNDASDPLWIKDGDGEIVGADVYYNGGAQNPFLAPIVATQFDASLEWYFADVGSASFAVFHKEFDDYIQVGSYFREMENNGITEQVEVRGPLNAEGAKINGFEVAYQSFFDFLPAPFDGLGVQANYTYINNEGITNSNVSNVGGAGDTITGQAPDRMEVNKLEGLSDDSYTIIGMYEKDSISARVAYSWRSEYLVTVIDCCVAYPVWNDDYGQVDASIRWHMNDNWEFMLSGSNLNNAETKLRQQVTNVSDGGLTLPNAWFQNDRRFTLSFRYRTD